MALEAHASVEIPQPLKIWIFSVIFWLLNAYSEQKTHPVLLFDAQKPSPAST